MSESIEIAGIEIPQADWEATPASVRAVVRLLSERLSHIEEQLNQNSSNSSRPPSSDTLTKSKPKDSSKSDLVKDKRESSSKNKRNRSEQASKGKGFGFYLVDERDIHHHIPQVCGHCGEYHAHPPDKTQILFPYSPVQNGCA